MTTIYNVKENFFRGGNQYLLVELRGLSTDEKPTLIGDVYVENGSAFIEIDTGKVYLYDLVTTSWIEV